MDNIVDFLNELRLIKETKFITIEITVYDDNDFAQVTGVYDNFDKAYEGAIVDIAKLNDYAKKPVIVDPGNGICIEHYPMDEDNPTGYKFKTYILPIDKKVEFLK